MERLVTIADIQKYPQLLQQGVSVNQNYDFTGLEESETDKEVDDDAAEKKSNGTKPKKK